MNLRLKVKVKDLLRNIANFPAPLLYESYDLTFQARHLRTNDDPSLKVKSQKRISKSSNLLTSRQTHKKLN